MISGREFGRFGSSILKRILLFSDTFAFRDQACFLDMFAMHGLLKNEKRAFQQGSIATVDNICNYRRITKTANIEY